MYAVGGADDEFLLRDHGEAGLRRPALPTFSMDMNSLLLKAKFQDTWRVVRSWGLPTVSFRCSYHGGHMACREELRLPTVSFRCSDHDETLPCKTLNSRTHGVS